MASSCQNMSEFHGEFGGPPTSYPPTLPSSSHVGAGRLRLPGRWIPRWFNHQLLGSDTNRASTTGLQPAASWFRPTVVKSRVTTLNRGKFPGSCVIPVTWNASHHHGFLWFFFWGKSIQVKISEVKTQWCSQQTHMFSMSLTKRGCSCAKLVAFMPIVAGCTMREPSVIWNK